MLIFIFDNKFLYFIMFRFFHSNLYFTLNYWAHFADSKDNTITINTINV